MSRMVRERVVAQHAAGTNHPEKIRSWYNLAGGSNEIQRNIIATRGLGLPRG